MTNTTQTLTLQQIEPLTHDVNRLVFDRPEGYSFRPGQATDLALDLDGWRDEARPFTFTSLPGEDRLEFTIKSYPSHDGVTKRIARLTPGDTVRIGEAWGAIEDKGPGTFIAGGAGLTPFLAILRNRLVTDGDLDGSTLLFSNRCERDIILRDELIGMPGLRCVFTVTDESVPDLPQRMIDGAFLEKEVRNWDDTFYVCGPPPMVEAVTDALRDRGAARGQIVTEEA